MKTRLIATAALSLLPAVALAGSWRFQSEKDAMTDETLLYAYVMNGSGYRHTEMWARCTEQGGLGIWFFANDYIGSSSSNGGTNDVNSKRIKISYRVNDEQAVRDRYADLSTDGTAFFFRYDDFDAVLRGLRGNRLLVEWRDYRGVSYSVNVSTRGATATLKKLPCAQEFVPVCGDGILQSGEACDAGKANSDANAALCRKDCTRNPFVCGNAIVQDGEACDDGNNISGDGCEADCKTSPAARASSPAPSHTREGK